MKIHKSFQIFPHKVSINQKDLDRLNPHRRSWATLSNVLLLDVSIEDVEKLILLELWTQDRAQIINRLVQRWVKLQKIHLLQRLNKISNERV